MGLIIASPPKVSFQNTVYRRPPQISTHACRDNRRDFALEIEK